MIRNQLKLINMIIKHLVKLTQKQIIPIILLIIPIMKVLPRKPQIEPEPRHERPQPLLSVQYSL